MKKIKVLIIDDSLFIREMLSGIMASHNDIEVVGTASDVNDARNKIKQLLPDVLTLDIEMPGMDGIEFLEKIMTLRPMPVIMISSLTTKGAEISLRALEIGAFDYIAKPNSEGNAHNSWGEIAKEIVETVKQAGHASATKKAFSVEMHKNKISHDIHKKPIDYKIIAIGSSTGGVEALRILLSKITSDFPPIVIVQHMSKDFVSPFAKRLCNITTVKVSEAEDNLRLMSGNIYIAPGDKHLKIVKIGNSLICKLDHEELVSGHRPSVDVLFSSVANLHIHAIGIILTGMGRDGASGLLEMRDSGALTIGQSAKTCVVYGMSKVANSIGAVEKELDLEDIVPYILQNIVK